MLLIVANRWDESASALALRLEGRGARLLTPRDLSCKGWRQRLGRPSDCAVVLGDAIVPQHRITAVLTRLPCVFEQELMHIVETDRPYVAAEMNAFLSFWLTSLRCPVINRPAPGCLNGPAWRPAKWAQLAAQAGFSVPSFNLAQPPSLLPDPTTQTTITVIGKKCLGKASARLAAKARRLAALSGVELLTIRLSGKYFQGIDLAPDLSNDAAISAIIDTFDRAPKGFR